MFSEQLFHPRMRIKFTAFNKKCPNSCLQRAVTLEEIYKMFSPGGLGGYFQFSVVKDIPLRTSSIIVDMTGPFEILCDTRICTTKVWILLILNPATQFLELEILDDSSSASTASALIRFMSYQGSKNIFLSDMGSNFWPLATKYAAVPDEEIKSFHPCGRDFSLRMLRPSPLMELPLVAF